MDAMEGDCNSAKKYKAVDGPQSDFSDGNATEKQEEKGGSSGKRRCSGWDVTPVAVGDSTTSKKRKTRWSSDEPQLKILGPLQLPDFMKQSVEAASDPELVDLRKKLAEINKRIMGQTDPVLPLYDDFGMVKNNSEVRSSEELVKERSEILLTLIKKDPTFKDATDYLPPMLQKKLYIPVEEYPEYNFKGIIIGPQGNTLKRMEKETGASIKLRGKGLCKKRRDPKPDPTDKEDLHVLIEADNQKSLDKAVAMIEKLLIPVDDGNNEHKRAQLKELAELNGTVRPVDMCSGCGDKGHRKFHCPHKFSNFMGISCDVCGRGSHSTLFCPLTMSTHGSNLANQGSSFINEPEEIALSTPPVSSSVLWGCGNSMLSPSAHSLCSHLGLGSTPTTGSDSSKIVDGASICVGHLPQTMDDAHLKKLFSSFGRIVECEVIKDRSTGTSKGFGFVSYDNPISATKAVRHMNSFNIEGKILQVRIQGRVASVSKDRLSQAAWPGPPGSMLPDYESDTIKNADLGLPPLSVFLGHNDSPEEHLLSSQASSQFHIYSSPDIGSMPSTEKHKENQSKKPTVDSKFVPRVDGASVYVGSLPQTVDANRLKELFSSFGTIIETSVIRDGKTGASNGFGFVNYDNPVNAAKAVQCMNGYKIDGKFLAVRIKGPPAPVSKDSASCGIFSSHPGNSFVGESGCLSLSSPSVSNSVPWECGNSALLSPSPADSSYSHLGLGSLPTMESECSKKVNGASVYVRYLPQTVDENRLKELFSSFGRIFEAVVIKDRSTGASKGFGFVNYDNPINAAKAVQDMNHYKLDGNFLEVRIQGLLAPKSQDSPSQGVPANHQDSSFVGESEGLALSTPPVSSSFQLGCGNSISSSPLGHSSCSYPGLGSTPTMDSESNKKANGASVNVGYLPLTVDANQNKIPTVDSRSVTRVDGASVYVGCLPQTVDANRLMELFSSFGMIIDATVIRDGRTGASNGFGFVNYDNPINAAKAVQHMHGYKIDGKFMAVRIKEPSAPVSKDSTSQGALANHHSNSFVGGSGGLGSSTQAVSSSVLWGCGNPAQSYALPDSYSHTDLGSTPTMGSRSSKKVDGSAVFVRCLPQTVDENRLEELFSSFGRIIGVTVIRDRSTGSSKGYGFVNYDNPIDAAKAAQHMNRFEIDRHVLVVSIQGQLAPVVRDSPSQGAWPGPPGSMLSEPESGPTKFMGLDLPSSSVFSRHYDYTEEHLPSFHGQQFQTPTSSHRSLEQFPGHPYYPTSQDQPYFIPPPSSNIYQQLPLTQPPNNYLTSSNHLPAGATSTVGFGCKNFIPEI